MLLLTITLLAAAPGPTLAVSYFDNPSKAADLEPLRKGLADMLITDLQPVKGLKLVEREKLELVLKELKLSSTPFIDPKTAQKLGRGLAASHLLIGSVQSVKGTLRIDARVFKVETGEVVASDKVEGKTDDFFDMEKDLANLLIRSLELKLGFDERKGLREMPTRSFTAFVSYANGLDARDRGDQAKAATAFAAAVAADPEYRAAKTALGRLAVVEQRIETAKGSEFDQGFAALDPKAPDVARKLKALLYLAGFGIEPEAVTRRLRLLDFILKHELKPVVDEGPAGVLAVEPAIFFNTIPITTDVELSKRAAPVFEYFMLRYPGEMYTTSWHQTWKSMRETLGDGLASLPERRAEGLRIMAIIEARLPKLRAR